MRGVPASHSVLRHGIQRGGGQSGIRKIKYCVLRISFLIPKGFVGNLTTILPDRGGGNLNESKQDGVNGCGGRRQH